MSEREYTRELNVFGLLEGIANMNKKPENVSFQDFLELAQTGGAPKFQVYEAPDKPNFFVGFVVAPHSDGSYHMVLENNTFVRAKMEGDKFIIQETIPGTN